MNWEREASRLAWEEALSSPAALRKALVFPPSVPEAEANWLRETMVHALVTTRLDPLSIELDRGGR